MLNLSGMLLFLGGSSPELCWVGSSLILVSICLLLSLSNLNLFVFLSEVSLILSLLGMSNGNSSTFLLGLALEVGSLPFLYLKYSTVLFEEWHKEVGILFLISTYKIPFSVFLISSLELNSSYLYFLGSLSLVQSSFLLINQNIYFLLISSSMVSIVSSTILSGMDLKWSCSLLVLYFISSLLMLGLNWFSVNSLFLSTFSLWVALQMSLIIKLLALISMGALLSLFLVVVPSFFVMCGWLPFLKEAFSHPYSLKSSTLFFFVFTLMSFFLI